MGGLFGFGGGWGGSVQKNLRKLDFHSGGNPACSPVLDALHAALLGIAKHPSQLCGSAVVSDQFGIGHADITHYV